MADELHPFDQALFPYEAADRSSDTLHKAGRVAVAVALASTLAAGPVNADAYELPQPTPIVYVLQPPVPDVPAVVADEPANDEETIWQRLMKLLKYALIVLLLLGTCIFGAVKGCSAVVGMPLLPASSTSSSAEAASDNAIPAAA